MVLDPELQITLLQYRHCRASVRLLQKCRASWTSAKHYKLETAPGVVEPVATCPTSGGHAPMFLVELLEIHLNP